MQAFTHLSERGVAGQLKQLDLSQAYAHETTQRRDTISRRIKVLEQSCDDVICLPMCVTQPLGMNWHDTTTGNKYKVKNDAQN